MAYKQINRGAAADTETTRSHDPIVVTELALEEEPAWQEYAERGRPAYLVANMLPLFR